VEINLNVVTVNGVSIGKGIPKVIIPLMGTTLEELKLEIATVKQEQPDIIEWRVDALNEANNIHAVLHALSEIKPLLEEVPLLFTFRSFKEGGEKKTTLEFYDKLLQKVIESNNIDLIDIELFTGGNVQTLVQKAKKHHISVLLSNHDFKTTPSTDEMLSRLLAMQNAGADITKLAVMPNNMGDVLRLLTVAEMMKTLHATQPFITIAMGPLGVLSRIAGEFVGSAASFGSGKQASAPGQITAAELKYILKKIHMYLQA
jgi:3-dehydroquinate dehydratase I